VGKVGPFYPGENTIDVLRREEHRTHNSATVSALLALFCRVLAILLFV
jgi:hypothetical protein